MATHPTPSSSGQLSFGKPFSRLKSDKQIVVTELLFGVIFNSIDRDISEGYFKKRFLVFYYGGAVTPGGGEKASEIAFYARPKIEYFLNGIVANSRQPLQHPIT